MRGSDLSENKPVGTLSLHEDGRSYWLDNTKAILVTLVVVAHFIGVFFGRDGYMKSAYEFIYLFHMPAFMMISGYFSKRRVNEREYEKTFHRLLLPYIIYYCAGLLVSGFVGNTMKFDIFSPTYGLWYIPVLGIFQLITPTLLDKFHKHLMWISVVVMVIALSYNPLMTGPLLRVLTYFPYFLMGYFLDPKLLAKFNSTKFRRVFSFIVAILFFVLVFVAIRALSEYDLRDAIWHIMTIRKQSESSTLSIGMLILLNIGTITMAFVCSFMIILASPRRKTFFSYIGKYSVYVYILHIQIAPVFKYVYAKSEFGIPELINSQLGQLAIAILAVMLSFLLASKPVRKITRAFVEPRFNLSFMKKLIHND